MGDTVYDTIEQILRDRFALMGAEYDAADLDSAVTDTMEGLKAAGYVIVPTDPTFDQRYDGKSVCPWHDETAVQQMRNAEEVYRAMIAARPPERRRQ